MRQMGKIKNERSCYDSTRAAVQETQIRRGFIQECFWMLTEKRRCSLKYGRNGPKNMERGNLGVKTLCEKWKIPLMVHQNAILGPEIACFIQQKNSERKDFLLNKRNNSKCADIPPLNRADSLSCVVIQAGRHFFFLSWWQWPHWN